PVFKVLHHQKGGVPLETANRYDTADTKLLQELFYPPQIEQPKYSKGFQRVVSICSPLTQTHI
uniref:hypothetical protein n=1 Tax=Cryptobacterium curtum TaxID=84163 RepID=UPI00248D97C0